MKKQTFITVAYDEEGSYINFERWSYKSANTCKRWSLQLYRDFGSLYKLDEVAKLVCYATPNGVDKDYIAWELSHDEIIKELEA